MKLAKEVTHKHTIKSFSTLEERFRKTHGEKYDYSKVVFLNGQTKVIITCPEHGDFEQTPSNHIRGFGCSLCGNESKSKHSLDRHTKNRISTKDWIDQVKFTHKDKYDYSKTDYRGLDFKLTITCPIHGDWEQVAYSHQKGHGCPKCAKILTTEQFIKKANVIHKGKFLYHNTNYSRHNELVTITCPIHGDFEQEAHTHLKGHGCQKCAKKGFKKDKPGVLYYFKIDHNGQEYFKIGVTNNTLSKRYTQEELVNCEILYIEPFKKGIEAFNLEQLIINSFKSKLANLTLLKNGNTEIFIEDVFNYKQREYYEKYKINKSNY